MVHNRKDRIEGDFKLGKRLWSPTKSKSGSDIYKNMRLVETNDVIFHLIDNKDIVAISRAESGYNKTKMNIGSVWDGDIYYIDLKDFIHLDKPIKRDLILSNKNSPKLQYIANNHTVFYDSHLNLRQGAYLTECPTELAELLASAYLSITHESLPFYTSSAQQVDQIEVYLKMKNASAEGIYNPSDDSITVKKGAIFEENVSESFTTHNYLKLRLELINSGMVVNNILSEDYLFSSLSASAAVIGGKPAAGPIEWKLKDGRTVRQYLETQNHWTAFSAHVLKHIADHFRNDYLKEAKMFTTTFPLEKLINITLEEYDSSVKSNTFTEMLEKNTRSITNGSFTSYRNKLFFNVDGDYQNSKYISEKYPQLTVDERFNLYREDIYLFISEFDENNYVPKEYSILSKDSNFIRSKILNIYYPDTLLYIDNLDVLRRILTFLASTTVDTLT